MSKRVTTIVMAALCVLAIAASVFALAPMLLGDGASAAAAGGGQDAATVLDAGTPQASGNSTTQGRDGEVDAEDSSDNQNDATGTEDTDGSGSSSGGSSSGSVNGSGGGGGGGTTNPSNSPNNSASNNPSNSNDNSTTTTPPPAPAQPTCTLSIDAEVMGMGYFMSARTVTFTQGESVFDVLQRECRNSGIPMEHSFYPLYNSVYVEGINNLYEFDGGAQSGWMYSVNGWYPNYGCSVYTLNDGDVIRWRYTKSLGADIGGSSAVTG
jgi:hypothetical protein